MKRVAVLPGDGIGPEVVAAVLPVIEGLGLPIEFRHGAVGWESWCETGNSVPPETWQLLKDTDTALLGAVSSKPVREAEAELASHLRGTGAAYVSPVVQLRVRLALFANVRPVTDLEGDRFGFVVIRENTEGLYAGLDFHGMDDLLWEKVKHHPNAARSGPGSTSATIRLQTRYGIDRLLGFGLEYARRNGHRRLTVADKPNVLRQSSSYLRDRLEVVAAAYPEIETEILNVDATALWMVRSPERFGVIVAENMFGDILSDLGAAVMGGLGLAPSANIGESGSYFEPVHGSAPPMAGSGRANPMATFLTVAMLLQHLDMPVPADQIRAAVRAMVCSRRSVTYDLGGTSSTVAAAKAVQDALGAAEPPRQASVITVGDELLSGRVLDTNTAKISALLDEAGYHVRAHLTTGDTHADIKHNIVSRLSIDDVVVVVGGLGPTSDDITRDAVAAACGVKLEHRETAWQAVQDRMESFNLAAHEDDRRQALFPVGSELLPNSNGTAAGARITVGRSTVVMVPGPPRECIPMVSAALAELPTAGRDRLTMWRLLGVVEGDIAAEVDAVLAHLRPTLQVRYRWDYPFVDVSISQPSDAPELPPELDRLLSPHTVSRHGRDAFAELGAAGPLALRRVAVDLGEPELLDGLRGAGIVIDASVSGPALELTGRASRSDEGVGRTGSMCLSSTVEVGGSTHTFTLSVPNRGPEVADYAAQFHIWSCLRALAAQAVA